MKKIQKHLLILPFACSLAFGVVKASAQINSVSPSGPDSFELDNRFQAGQHELSLGAGTLFSPFVVVNGRPTINYAFGDAQLGFMVTDVAGPGLFRGNFELAPEFFGSGIFEGTGTYIVGGVLWFRYNFVPCQSKIIPYVQTGGGWVFMDIDHRYDGENFNFNLDAAVGLRYFIKPRVSLNIEYRVQHISNANLWQHNLGVNAEGPVVGISWLF